MYFDEKIFKLPQSTISSKSALVMVMNLHRTGHYLAPNKAWLNPLDLYSPIGQTFYRKSRSREIWV